MRSVPDDMDKVNAFRAGYRRGADAGPVSPREAEAELRALHTTIPITSATVDCFCNGSEDGAKRDAFRYLLSYAVAP